MKAKKFLPEGLEAKDAEALRGVIAGKLEDYALMDILSALTEKIYREHGNKKPQERPLCVERRWQELLDMMVHINSNEPDPAAEMPRVDPLRLIHRAEKEGLLEPQDAQNLSSEFNDKVKEITGAELNAGQIAQLYKLMVFYRLHESSDRFVDIAKPELGPK